ncbi:MAG: aminotransferase class III-fold pyridoxal phosphate-dependent enzyme [bacterium]|nr:aminotransferase class III-fold pyridoxal phosphate-dependent enzyme [bacterium]MDZ4285778.1 aminotransferase class III-fold pyridoxal phosphate-dependent enzyme [Candidatus Sungbacteria bacterium]
MTFPGTNTLAVLRDTEKYYATNTMDSRILAASGNNAIITDPDGNTFIDLHCGAGVNNLGMNNPHIMAAIQAQLQTGIIHAEHHNAPNAAAIELSQLLAETCPVYKPSKVFLSNSGAEANEAAIKICEAVNFHSSPSFVRHKAIYFENGFAGRTHGVLSATSSNPSAQRDPYWNHCDQENSIYLPYPTKNNATLLKERLQAINLEEVDRLLIELPCQGEGGIIPAHEETLHYLYEVTGQAGIFWITDAIQCGMGRCGTLYGPEIFPWLTSDILTLAKALGGGIPMGATIFRADLDWQRGEHSNTFGGGALACRVALSVIEQISQLLANGTVATISRTIESFAQTLLAHPCITDVRGIGAMWAIEFTSPTLREMLIRMGEETRSSQGHGLKLLSAGKKSMRIMPPLTIEPALLIHALETIDLMLSKLDE